VEGFEVLFVDDEVEILDTVGEYPISRGVQSDPFHVPVLSGLF